MPIFEVMCKDCQKLSEILILRSDDCLYCEHCKSVNVQKLVSGKTSIRWGCASPAQDLSGYYGEYQKRYGVSPTQDK